MTLCKRCYLALEHIFRLSSMANWLYTCLQPSWHGQSLRRAKVIQRLAHLNMNLNMNMHVRQKYTFDINLQPNL